MKKILYKTLNIDKEINIIILTIAFILLFNLLNVVNTDIFYNIYDTDQAGLRSVIRDIFLIISVLLGLIILNFLNFNKRKQLKDYKTLLSLGLNRKNLFYILFKISLEEMFISILLGLPLALFFMESFNLATISFFNLDLNNHNFVISLRLLVIPSLILLIFLLISDLLVTMSLTKDYPLEKDKKNGIKTKFIFIIATFVLVYFYKKYPYYNQLVLFVIIILGFIITILWVLSKILRKTKKYNVIVRALANDFFAKERLSLGVIILLVIISNILLLHSINQFKNYKTDKDLRPDFTIFMTPNQVNSLKKVDIFSKFVSKTYPINLVSVDNIDDADFTNSVSRLAKDRYYFLDKDKKVMDYSSYKNIFKDSSKKISDTETIYLIENKNNLNNKLSEYVKRNNISIAISGETFKVKDIDNSEFIFANNNIEKGGVYVINDRMYNKLIKINDPYAYNLDLNDYYIQKYGYDKVSESLRNEFFNREVRFESLVWMIKVKYSEILGYLYMMVYFSIVLLFMGACFLSMKFLNILTDNYDSKTIIQDLGASSIDIKNIINHFLNLSFKYLILIILSVIYTIIVFTIRIGGVLSNDNPFFIAILFITPLLLSVFIHLFVKVFINIFISNLE